MSILIKKIAVGVAFSFTTSTCFAAGIPVYDALGFSQNVQSLIAWGQQAKQMIDQINETKNHILATRDQIKGMTGKRLLGELLNNPELNKLVPPEYADVFLAMSKGGKAGLSSLGKLIRAESEKYGCADRDTAQRISCESVLSQSAQRQANSKQAMELSNQRLDQIAEMQKAIDNTEDAKSIAELTARIGTLTVELITDANRLAIANAYSQEESKIAEQKLREATLVLLSPKLARTGKGFVFK